MVKASDLRGAARLAADATAGLTDLVEAVHARIARSVPLPGLTPARPGDRRSGRTRGLTGLVYGSVRGVTRLVGGSVDALLGLLSTELGPGSEPGPEREALVAALNGVLGDHLQTSGNPLAIQMTLRRDARALVLKREALAERLPDAGPTLLVLLHGLCMSDLQWQRAGHDHGAALARDAGFTPVYLHYNSGLHVSTNGQALAALLEPLVDAWPGAQPRVVLLGHSMGGLLARSALHHGRQAGQRWPARVSDLVCLGTPHFGAPLERAGNWVDLLLGATPYAAPLARLGKIRSAGITDLRHGSLLDADWQDRDRFARGPHRPQPLPLPEDVRCFALAATTGRRDGDLKDRLLGDGLVPLDSALGRSADTARALAFPPAHQWVGYGMNHLDLLGRPEVYAQLRAWLA